MCFSVYGIIASGIISSGIISVEFDFDLKRNPAGSCMVLGSWVEPPPLSLASFESFSTLLCTTSKEKLFNYSLI